MVKREAKRPRIASRKIRRPLQYAALLAACLLSASLAHEQMDNHLARTALCADSDSVRAVVETPVQQRGRTAETTITRRLGETLGTMLAASEVEIRDDSCRGADGYIVLSADVRYLDPESYIGFGTDPYTYEVSLRVGAYVNREAEMLKSVQYAARTSDIYPEGDRDAPLEEEIVAQGRTLTRRLISFWWEDNPRRGSVWVMYRPQIFGVALTLLTIGVTWLTLKARGETRVKVGQPKR